MPGAWGVVWADLTKLDYRHTDLWQYMANIFLLWCRRGVDGFRCDAGYMIPEPAWEYIIAKVRSRYPNTVFFLEGLGGPPDATRHLLQRANFNWAYSELFQEYSLEQISNYMPHAIDLSDTCGHLVHFAENHDNDRLAKVSPYLCKDENRPLRPFQHLRGIWICQRRGVVCQRKKSMSTTPRA